MSEDVFVVEDFFWCASFGNNEDGNPELRKDKSMPKVWFGKNAEKKAIAYIDEFARINNWTECEADWNKEKAFRGRALGEGKEEWFSAKQLTKLVSVCINI